MTYIAREIKTMVENELENFPVGYRFGHGGKHAYVEIETREGMTAKVTLPSALGRHSSTTLNTRAYLRKTLRDLGIGPINKRAARMGGLGEALADAAAKVEPPPLVTIGQIELPPAVHIKRRERVRDDPMPVLFADAAPLCPDAIREASQKSVASVPAPAQPKKEPETMLAKTEPKPTPEKAPFVKLTQAEQVAAMLLIMQNAVVDRAAKLCTYKDSYSDEKLHAEVTAENPGRGLKLETIVDFRRNHFGATPAERERADKARAAVPTDIHKSIEALQATVASLVSRVTSLEDAATRPTT